MPDSVVGLSGPLDLGDGGGGGCGKSDRFVVALHGMVLGSPSYTCVMITKVRTHRM